MDREIPRFLRATVVTGLLLMTACAGPSSKQAAIRAPEPPADYVYLGSGDLRKYGHTSIVIDFDKPTGESSTLPVMLGVGFSGAMHDGAPPAPPHSGKGDGVSDPIKFSTVPPDDELDASGDYMAETFPGAADVVAHFYRSPQSVYLMRVEFQIDARPNAIYVDVSRYVARRKSFQ